MSAFPFFVELEGIPCLMVGGGRVAWRKTQALLSCGARVTVVAPALVGDWSSHPGLTCLQRPFREADICPDYRFVIAASDDWAVNARVATLCRERSIPFNRADEGGSEGFLFPALVQKGDLTIGISTSGASPRAAHRIRQLVEAALPQKIGEILSSLRSARAEILRTCPPGEERTALLRTGADESLRQSAPLTRAQWEALASGSGQGRVDLVGAGCGKADLITLRGLRLIWQCDALVYDELIDKALLEQAPPQAQRIPMGKRAGGRSARQEDIIATLISLAREGKRVVRLKGGDPYLFGRGGEELLALQAAGIPCGQVPGIPSALGIPAEYGIPVTHRGLSRSLHIITAHVSDGDGLPPDMAQYARLEGTLVFLMGLQKLEALTQSLISHGKSPQTPAAVLSGGNAPHPVCIRGTLETLPALAGDAQPPAIILVGPVAALNNEQLEEET